MFEAFAIKVLQGTKSIQDAAEILKLDWHSCLEMMTLAVDRGLKRGVRRKNWYSSGITNAIGEGFNSKIQALKSNARGFRNFENYRITILFNCGRLDMMPDPNF